ANLILLMSGFGWNENPHGHRMKVCHPLGHHCHAAREFRLMQLLAHGVPDSLGLSFVDDWIHPNTFFTKNCVTWPEKLSVKPGWSRRA
ncbi:MAG: hypothetical protein ACKON9_03385, partial [Planctomycetaceae bacterium]